MRVLVLDELVLGRQRQCAEVVERGDTALRIAGGCQLRAPEGIVRDDVVEKLPNARQLTLLDGGAGKPFRCVGRHRSVAVPAILGLVSLRLRSDHAIHYCFSAPAGASSAANSGRMGRRSGNL